MKAIWNVSQFKTPWLHRQSSVIRRPPASNLRITDISKHSTPWDFIFGCIHETEAKAKLIVYIKRTKKETMKFTWGIFPVREVKTASSWVSLLNAKRSSWNKGKKRWHQLPLLWLQFFFQLWGDSLNEAPNAFSKRNVCFDFFLTFGHQILTSETSNSNGRPIEDEWHSVSRNRADTALWNIFPRNWSSMHTIFYPTKLLLFCL